MTTICPYCKTEMPVSDTAVGKARKCKNCQKNFIVKAYLECPMCAELILDAGSNICNHCGHQLNKNKDIGTGKCFGNNATSHSTIRNPNTEYNPREIIFQTYTSGKKWFRKKTCPVCGAKKLKTRKDLATNIAFGMTEYPLGCKTCGTVWKPPTTKVSIYLMYLIGAIAIIMGISLICVLISGGSKDLFKNYPQALKPVIPIFMIFFGYGTVSYATKRKSILPGEIEILEYGKVDGGKK